LTERFKDLSCDGDCEVKLKVATGEIREEETMLSMRIEKERKDNKHIIMIK
jgi:hypothetical protein